MLKGRKLRKLNNDGSTLVMAIIAIAFVALLATVILAASLANISMKRMESHSKNTFYTAESVLDEIRAGIGTDSVQSLGTSYEKVLTTLVRQGSEYKYIINNEEANKEFRKLFVEDMINKVTGGSNSLNFGSNMMVSTSDTAVLNLTKNYLDSFITGYSDGKRTAEVKSVGKVTGIKESAGLYYTIILQDVVVAYKEEKAADNYFSNVTVDLDITFPNLNVDFAGGNKLEGFTEYALIADKSINIAGYSLTVNAAHIYAGKNINITGSATSEDGGSLLVSGNVVSMDGDTKNPNVVSREDIVIRGTESNKSSMTINGGDIWCSNLTVDSKLDDTTDVSTGGMISIDALSNTFVSDDLNIFGQNSSVTIGGNYYGFSYDGSEITSHKQSSAIIINGVGSMLRLNVSKLIVGGRSYIDITGTDSDYTTGESLSVKADQDLYLVPAKYFYGNMANPNAKNTWAQTKISQASSEENPSGIPLVDVSTFFGKDLLKGTGADAYIVKEVGSNVYIYWNFKDKQSATEYVKRILSGSDAYLKATLNSYFASVFSASTSGISITSGSMYTAGMLMQSSGAAVNNVGSNQTGGVGDVTYANSSSIIPTDVFTLTSMNYSKRYEILKYLLVDIPEMKNGTQYIVNDEEAALKEFYDNYTPTGTDFSNDTSSNIVNYTNLMLGEEYNPEGKLVLYGSGVTKMAIDKDTFDVPSNVTGGIIISTGDVKLDHNFKGLIICKGTIKITDNATITTDAAMVQDLIKNEYHFDEPEYDETDMEAYPDFRNYFLAFVDETTEDGDAVKIENISYTDIVGCNNWRKYDDGK